MSGFPPLGSEAAGTGLTRRLFLSRLALGGGAVAAAPHVPGLGSSLVSALAPQAAPVGRVLVLVQLEGGNDGLDTVVPHTDPVYQFSRGALARRPDQLSPLDDTWGLHAMPALAGRWAAGQLAVVHGVHYPRPELSHFSSAAVWWAGSTDAAETTGWVGRALEALVGADGDPLTGLAIDALPPVMNGRRFQSASAGIDPAEVVGSPADHLAHRINIGTYRRAAAPAPEDPPLAAAIRGASRQALTVGAGLGPRMAPAPWVATFPERMGAVAAMIRAGLPTRVYHVHHGGDFDVHGGAERQPLLLADLDTGIDRLFADLGPAGDDVVVCPYSEFGRRLVPNGNGTDHGTASVQLVVGPKVNGGHHGEPTDLRRLDPDGNLVATTDFRKVFAALLADWLGVDPDPVFGKGIQPVPVV